MSTTTPPNPWALLAVQVYLRLRIESLPNGYRGLTDGQTIWLSDRLSQRERRCTLVHELIHIERGHRGHQPAAEVADALWVTDDLLRTRLATLTPADRHYVASTTTT
ncbi:MAG: ImmA/IrrE family metallo-endopeptidase [Propionibacteriaceae bacterium]|nr:ImmA/IrrE family metallo-endopeptidase [Propionibacteriaceae bacterium]